MVLPNTRINRKGSWKSEECSEAPSLPSHPVVLGSARGLHVVSVAVILTFLLPGVTCRAKWLVLLPTHSWTHTDWGIPWSLKLHQMHGMYRRVVRRRPPWCSPQELNSGRNLISFYISCLSTRTGHENSNWCYLFLSIYFLQNINTSCRL
jgi:hypothetical protein